MELNFDEFFEILFDQNPHFDHDFKDIIDSFGNEAGMFSILKYKQFDNLQNYKATLFDKGSKILRQFKIDLSNNEINNGYLECYLEDLKIELGNFIEVNIRGKEYLCHRDAYVTSSYYGNPHASEDEILDITKIEKDSNIANEFINYNKYRYEVIQLMVKELESLLSKVEARIDNLEKQDASANTDDFGKLELNKSTMSDIALLFRLLDENKVFTAKYKTHIFRVIKNSFKGSDKSTFNEGSIKNAFNEPDPNSVENLKFLLANMKASLKNI